jgi:phosphoribosylformylglycinamidine synthase subunit PurQ / glutaminase
LPGGFSYGDYLRCGAIARFSPIMQSVVKFAAEGGLVVGICNGFQILCEAHLLRGALTRNRSLSFICEQVSVRVENPDTRFTSSLDDGEILSLPIKHGEGCYVAPESELLQMEERGQVILRYVDREGRETNEANPNGSMHAIAGVANERFNVFGLMPHPEHAVERNLLGGADGRKLFQSIIESAR